MDTSISNEGKKSNLEDLSKEELLKKCKGLLTIAQKAKQARDILSEENAKLKQELSNKNKNDVSEELVENLTQQKLSLVTAIEDLKAKNTALDSKLQIYENELKTCQEKLDTADNENVSYKRQLTRLTDENEQLLNHLDSLEKQIDELNKIGIQQRQQLLELETKSFDNKNIVDENKVTELQCMLSVSLEEVKKLKNENIILNERVENLNINLSEKNKNILLISDELKLKCDTLEKVTRELHEMQSNKEIRNDILEDYEKLKSQCLKLKEANELLQKDNVKNRELEEHIIELNGYNERLKEKLKLYHSKIIKFAGNTKALKEEKNTVLQLFKQYTEQVKEWKEQLNNVAKGLVEQVSLIQSENQELKDHIDRQNQENNSQCNIKEELTNTIAKKLEEKEAECLKLNKTVEDSSKIITEYKNEIEIIRKDLEDQNNQLTSQETLNSKLDEGLTDTIARYEEQLKLLKEELEAKTNITRNLEEKEAECLKLTKTVTDSSKIISEYKNEIEILRRDLEDQNNQLTSQETLNSKLDEGLTDTIARYEEQLKTFREELEAKTNIAKKLEEKETECLKLTKTVEDSSKIISEYKNEIEILRRDLEDSNNRLTSQDTLNKKLDEQLSLIKDENAKILEKFEDEEKKRAELDAEMQIILKSNKELKNEIEDLNNAKKSVNMVIKENNARNTKKLEDYQKKLSDNEKLVSSLRAQLKKYEDDEIKLAEKSSEEIMKLVEETKNLGKLSSTLQEKVDELESKRLNVFDCATQTSEDLIPTNELEEQIANLKRENTELLSEMNEMNQALKERGENISKLEAHCEEIMKKLQIYETQANKNVDSISEKEEVIKNLTEEINSLKAKESNNSEENSKSDPSKEEEVDILKREIENLKEKLNSNLETSYAESETMSTSTVSRTEDMNRLRDLEGSWEERYGKLRTLAIKLKGKIRDLTNSLTKEQGEKEELQKKLSANLKTTQTLQSESDKLEDELEKSKQESKQFLDRLNTIAEDISKDKQSLVSQDDVINELKKEIETLKTEKQSTDNWKKQVSAKVQTLRKELEANNVLRKDFENKITKLTADLDAKEQSLKAEIESHKQTRSLLDASNNECKKNSVLSLEMQDYERSVKETAKKLDKQQEQMTKWKGQVESQKSTINALREQNKMLEERVQEAEESINSYTTEINGYKKKIVQLEEQIQQKEEKIESINELFETSRLENEELSTELSKVIAEHQKTNNILKSERDHLRSQTLGLQQNLREVQDALKLKEDELIVIRSEYEGYKVRAQSVLRQNQSRDVGLEEKLTEEVASLKVQNSQLSAELEKTIEAIKALEEANVKLTAEKEEGVKKIHDLEVDIEELKSQYAQLSSKHQTTLNEHAETVRSLKLHAETLSQCYRQQIADQESRHNREVIELQSRIEKCSTPVEAAPVLPTSAREEGEGSESIESTNPPKIYPVPLERLLGSDNDHELVQMKKQLSEQQSRLVHLTALLSDTEQDLAKHVQMNKLLKEEIRRQQRSEEREKHAENLEYLKNVVFKFLTLHGGDERSRLVPVLNTILKLSPEETHKLNSVAKGDSGLKGWTNYLPTWPSPNKPS